MISICKSLEVISRPSARWFEAFRQKDQKSLTGRFWTDL